MTPCRPADRRVATFIQQVAGIEPRVPNLPALFVIVATILVRCLVASGAIILFLEVLTFCGRFQVVVGDIEMTSVRHHFGAAFARGRRVAAKGFGRQSGRGDREQG